VDAYPVAYVLEHIRQDLHSAPGVFSMYNTKRNQLQSLSVQYLAGSTNMRLVSPLSKLSYLFSALRDYLDRRIPYFPTGFQIFDAIQQQGRAWHACLSFWLRYQYSLGTPGSLYSPTYLDIHPALSAAIARPGSWLRPARIASVSCVLASCCRDANLQRRGLSA
jgi:hypothetical protein